ncbi:MAG: hypothetical protein M1455_04480 [Actinobacteria bacterium]|nr:hypothetical protein [Actinomycetota bacterium]
MLHATHSGGWHPHHATRAHAHHAAHAHAHHAAHAHPRPLSQRVLLEALFMTILAVLTLGAMFAIQNNNLNAGVTQSSVSYGINTGTEPVQSSTAAFKTSIAVPDGKATVSSNTSYTISAKVESAMSYSDQISSLIPTDLLLAWGDITQNGVDGMLSWQQEDRHGQVSGSLGGDGVDLTQDYVIRHVSNNHVVPANTRVAAAIAGIKAGDTIRIDGRLIDVRMALNDGRVLTVNTSKSRSDQGEGACEIIYVEHIRVNGIAY